jgi:predicted enzyme related to lactoylglutathione lyase
MAGEIVHVEFPAEDTDRAQRFWGGLFGWQFGPAMEGFDYRMAQTSPNSGVAVMKSDEPGHPNYYFQTDDIEASIAKVRDLAGTADDKQPVPSHGWFSPCTDSEGNHFHLWQPDPSAA